MTRYKLKDLSLNKLEYGSGAAAATYDGEVRYVRITDIDENGVLGNDIVSPNSIDEKYFLNDGDVLFARTGATVGKTYRYRKEDGKCIYAGFLIRVIPNQNLIRPDYLFFYTKSPQYLEFVKASMKVVAQPNINAKQYGELEFNVPSLDVQDDVINKLLKINRIIEFRKQQICLLDELIKARFVELFGDPEKNPFKWKKEPLSAVITTANNGMARRGNDIDGDIVMRLVELQDGYIDYSNPNRIILKDDEKKRYLLKDNDFLFARVNGNPDNVGRCAVFHDIGEDVYHNDHIIRAHFDENLLNGTFASSLFNSDYGKRQLKAQIKTSAGQYTVSQDGIGAIIAILPPMDIQEQFDSFVQQVDKSKFINQR